MVQVDNGSDEFWFDDGRSVAGAAAESIEYAQEYVGHQFPDELAELLKLRNGGVSNYSEYQGEGETFPIPPFLSVDVEAAAGSIMCAFDVREYFGVPERVVVFAAEGYSWLGLDYRSDEAEPSIVFRLNEHSEIEPVAESFSKFLAGMVV